MSDKLRPLSPHLSIYKPQITSVLSISHRLTGIFLSFGVIIFSVWIISAVIDTNIFKYINIFFVSFIGKIFLFFWLLSLFYHLFNGIRHLFWDFGYGFEIKNAQISGWVVLILSLIFSLIYTFCFLYEKIKWL